MEKKTKPADLKQLESEFDRVAMERYRLAMMTVTQQENEIAEARKAIVDLLDALPHPTALREAALVLSMLADRSYRPVAQQLTKLANHIERIKK